jgi:hypothetical protein
MKTLHDQRYICPTCKKNYSHQEWSEEQEPIELQCDACDKTTKSFSIPFVPSWGKYEEGMHSDDKKFALDSSEKFEQEREHAMRTDPKAARWEKGRKEGWQKDKPYYAKKVQEAGI